MRSTIQNWKRPLELIKLKINPFVNLGRIVLFYPNRATNFHELDNLNNWMLAEINQWELSWTGTNTKET